MCGIAGIINPLLKPVDRLKERLTVMSESIRHRGPDDDGLWIHPSQHAGFAHRRLSIIDLKTGHQPMQDNEGNWITYNGEIYNYIELRRELGEENFKTTSDTEVILCAYRRWGIDCVNRFRGMFAFALWDAANKKLFCARDRFGIKPFYYTFVDRVFYFASEAKALLPFSGVETDLESFKEYLTFQFVLGGKTLFKNVYELEPAHMVEIQNGKVEIKRYWEIFYNHDFDHTEKYFEEKLRELLVESVSLHMRSDVPIGGYISGGLDSGALASIAVKQEQKGDFIGFNGKFSEFGAEFDESYYASALSRELNFPLYQVDITARDFIGNIQKVIYHLDFPTAGPGSFPQFMVSRLSAQHRKVVLGGQGGDEIFGGYARYLIAYFEQCIKGAIDGTMTSGNFVVTYESIIPNLVSLQKYKPLMQEFWREGLFDSMDRRYFRLINRATDMGDEVDWDALRSYTPFDAFKTIFNGRNVKKESYFDLMTNFDFKTLLPALLQVEDRMSMAHGLESRVPLLDFSIVELAATIPSNIKFKNGTMKHIFKQSIQPFVPGVILDRKDKMGFPTPIDQWVKGDARDFVMDIFTSKKARDRGLIDNRKVVESLDKERKFGRKIWGLLSLELWQQAFHDRAACKETPGAFL